MNEPNGSARLLCLVIAAMCLLPSCASLTRGGNALTPSSEAICDQAPPAAVPPQPTTEPEHGAWVAILLGLLEWEVDKFIAGSNCRAEVREANAEAARKAR